MAHIVEQFISLRDLEQIQQHLAPQEFTHQGRHPETDQLQWENTALDSWTLDRLASALECHLGKDHEISAGSGVYQRCHIPFGIHTDSKLRLDPDRDPDTCARPGQALLIPLQQHPDFNTVIWREQARDDAAKQQIFQDFARLAPRDIRNSRLGQRLRLDHCWDDPSPLRKLYNHLELDTVFAWKLGSAVIWQRDQLHASSDFRGFHPHKDAIVIFFE